MTQTLAPAPDRVHADQAHDMAEKLHALRGRLQAIIDGLDGDDDDLETGLSNVLTAMWRLETQAKKLAGRP